MVKLVKAPLDVDGEAIGAAAYLRLYCRMKAGEVHTPAEYASEADITLQGARKRLKRVKRLLDGQAADDWLADYIELVERFERGERLRTREYAEEKGITQVGAWKRFDRVSEVLPLTEYQGYWMHVDEALRMYEEELLNGKKASSGRRRRVRKSAQALDE